MFLNPNKKKSALSISSRLIITYTFSAFILVVFAVSILYYALTKLIHLQDIDFITGEIHTIINIFQKEPNAQALAGDLYQEIILEPESTNYSYFVRLVKNNREVLVTPSLANHIPIDKLPVLHRGALLSKLKIVEIKKSQYSVMAARFIYQNNHYLIQIIKNSTHNKKLIDQYQLILIFVLFINIFLATFIGIYVTRTGLKPLNQLARLLSKIRVDKLNDFLNTEQWPKELQNTVLELNEMLKRIQESFQNLQEFSGNIAHELRTPLNNLMCQIEVCLNQPRASEEYYDTLVTSLEECQEMTHLIESMLFIAKSESPNNKIEKHQFALRPLLDSLVEYLQIMADEKKIQMNVNGEAKINGDARLIKQAFNNLIINSIKYSNPHSSITIKIYNKNDKAIIMIRDTGTGIPKNDLPHVFSRFYRVEKSRNRNQGGAGLGLAIVKSIVDLHHGSITIDSTENVGTTIIMTLPQ